jgi:hypothetical protein
MYNIVQEPTEASRGSLFAYFQKEAERNKDATCVFLLWGSRDSESFPTWAVDVQINSLKNEEKAFQRLAEGYSDKRDFLRQWLSFREYNRLEPVTV